MQRRAFLETAALAAVGGAMTGGRTVSPVAHGPNEWRQHFPALSQQVNGHPLAYLDSAATTLRANPVIDAIAAFDRTANANPGAALHTLARRSSQLYDEARRTVAEFVNAVEPGEVVFTRGTTDGINLVAAAWGGANLRSGDEILIGVAEHASNMLPWQLVAKKTGAVVRYFGVDQAGRPRLD
ncbi:MAG: aminotransferase class V-fold PLP-dependent enzyme, partial [Gemmatimonadaceae bacterium]